jgi:hypothetical protein
MAIHRVVLTYEDYLAMPDDGRRYEILDGEVLGLNQLGPPRPSAQAPA